jgi:hypothetical protein
MHAFADSGANIEPTVREAQGARGFSRDRPYFQ